MDVEQYVTDGDLGCGAPGSRSWHLCVIAQIEESEIAEYMNKAFGVDIGGDDIRDQAVRIINSDGK